MDSERLMDLLLTVLQESVNLEPLVRRGFEYHQIIKMMQEAESVGMVVLDEGGARLTELGIERLARVRRNKSLVGPDAWIVPDRDASVVKTDPWMVYLPRKNWRDD